ncbi:MAG: hypothetical protein AMJ92_00900 [candidate division Zixibacteria bacterium SM23_81]|nr:MAG: hypothetical protein AMJ92_00900 [candidate division Zixibacteria bacterium SM23_81]
MLSMAAMAEVPGLINYQGTLTDGGGVALDTTISITFSIYNDSTGGIQVWTETQTAVEVDKGLFNVLLGRVNSIQDTVFTEPERWLGIQVGGDPELEPRQRIASVGYSYRAEEADTAVYARSGGGGASGGWVDEGTVVRLETGTDSVGIGTSLPGYRLHVAGDIGINSSGKDGVYIDAPAENGIHIQNAGGYGVKISDAVSSGVFIDSVVTYDGLQIVAPNRLGIGIWNPGYDGLYVDTPIDVGAWIRKPGGNGVWITDGGSNGVEIDSVANVGLGVWNSGTDGIYVEASANDGVAIQTSGRFGVGIWDPHEDGVYIYSPTDDGIDIRDHVDNGVSVMASGGDGVHVTFASGRGGYFHTSNGTTYALYATNLDSLYPGLYVNGYAVITGTVSKVVQTSHGREAVSTLCTPYEEIMASGTGRLSNGEAHISFEPLFSDAISPRVPLKITITPSGKWSGIYIAERSVDGFTVRSETGALDVEFDWTAIGRRKGYEKKLALKIPTSEQELAELEAARSRAEPKAEKMEAKHRERKRLRPAGATEEQ